MKPLIPSLFSFALMIVPVSGQTRQFSFNWPLSQPSATVAVASIPVPGVPWLARFEGNLDKLPKGPYDLVFDGDSITDNWQSLGQPGPADLWQQKYGALKALNLGIGGDQVQNLIWRLQNGSLAGQDPKLIVVLIGTNNVCNGSTPSETSAGIQMLLGEYEARCPHSHILLLGVFPRGFTPTDPARALVSQLNEILSAANYGPRVTYFDFGSKFLQPDGSISPSTMGDGLHPAYAGYVIWANAIQPMIDQYVTNGSTSPSGIHATSHRDTSLTTGTTYFYKVASGNNSGTSTESSATPIIFTARQFSLDWPQPVRPEKVPFASFPVPRIDWVTSFEANIDKLQDGPYDLVFDGDQTTMGLTNQATWKEHYGSLKALNLGIWWDQVQNLTWRVQNGSLAGQNPKLIVLETGAMNNDGKQSPSEVAAGIQKLLGEYKTRCPRAHILLLGIFPRNPSPTDPVRMWISQVNQILATYAGPQVTYLDIGAQFLQPDGTLSTTLIPDGSNLSAQGYAAWVNAIQPVVDQYVNGILPSALPKR